MGKLKILETHWVDADEKEINRLKEKSIEAQRYLGLEVSEPLIIDVGNEYRLLHEIDLVRAYHLLILGKELY